MRDLCVIRGEEVLAAQTVGALTSERKDKRNERHQRPHQERDRQRRRRAVHEGHAASRRNAASPTQVVQILNHIGAPYKAINVLADGEIREGIKAFSNWPTIPQLYVKGEFVGGCDITREMFQSGELAALFDKEGIPHKAPAKA